MPPNGPNAVEIGPNATLRVYRCLTCGTTKLYLVQGKSGALPPQCWESPEGARHDVVQTEHSNSVSFAFLLRSLPFKVVP